MTDLKISQLPVATLLTGTELIELVQGGANVQSTAGAVSIQANSNFGLVSLLLHFDGTNGSNVFTDSSKNVLVPTLVGVPVLSTASPKFGTAALSIPAGTSNNYLSYATAANGPLDFVNGDFTIEFWLNPTATILSNSQILDLTNSGTTGLQIIGQVGGSLQLLYATGGSVNTNVAIPVNSWSHVVFERYGSQLLCYLNGILRGVSNAPTTIQTLAPNAFLGGGYVGGSNVAYQMDEFRLTKGLVRYTNGFTPPAQAFPNS